MTLDEIGATPLDGRIKGIPGSVAPFRLDEIGRHRWNLLREDLPLPAAVLKRSYRSGSRSTTDAARAVRSARSSAE